MAIDVQTSEIKASIAQNAADVRQEMLQKKANYDAAMNKLGIFKAAKEKAFAKFDYIKRYYKNDNTEYRTANSQYTSVVGQCSGAEGDADILRGSLMNSIFYNGRVSSAAILAS